MRLMTLLLILTLSLAALYSPTFSEESKREPKQFLYPINTLDTELMYLPLEQPSAAALPAGRQRLFFNIASLLSNYGSIPQQAQSQAPTCPACPTPPKCPVCLTCPDCPPAPSCPSCQACPPPPTCPTVTAPDVLSKRALSTCIDEDSAGECSVTSTASSGTFQVLWPQHTVDTAKPNFAFLTVTPQVPFTKVSVICPIILGPVSIRTSTGTIYQNIARVETDATVKITFTATPSTSQGLFMSCAWACHT